MAAANGLRGANMSDYISREAAVECAKHAYAKGLEPTQYIEEIPAADVAPVRHGRWERSFEDYRQQLEGDKCSVCGFEYYGTGIIRFRYCPSWGAKMEGGADG